MDRSDELYGKLGLPSEPGRHRHPENGGVNVYPSNRPELNRPNYKERIAAGVIGFFSTAFIVSVFWTGYIQPAVSWITRSPRPCTVQVQIGDTLDGYLQVEGLDQSEIRSESAFICDMNRTQYNLGVDESCGLVAGERLRGFDYNYDGMMGTRQCISSFNR